MFEFISSFLWETEWTKTIQEEDFFYFVFFVIIWSSVKKDQMCRTTLKRWTWSGRKIPRDLFISFHVWWSKTHFSLWHERKENSMCRNISLETFSSFVKQTWQFFKIYILTTYSLFVTKSICSLNVWLFLWLCLKAIRQNNKQTSNLFPGHEHRRENNSDHTQKKDQLVHFISLCADMTPLFLRTVVQK